MRYLKKPLYGLFVLGLAGCLTNNSHAASVYISNSSSYISFATLPSGLTFTTSSIGTSSFNSSILNAADVTVSALNSNGTGTNITDVRAYSEVDFVCVVVWRKVVVLVRLMGWGGGCGIVRMIG